MHLSIIFLPLVISSLSTKWSINKNQLYIVLMGDIGITPEKSKIRMKVQTAIRMMNLEKNFDLGIILGDNIYPRGVKTQEYDKIKKVFSENFPKNEFDIPFLTILGNHDHMGNINTQSEYFKIDERYFIPYRYYTFSITLKKDNTTITFVCADTTPLLDKAYQENFDVKDTKQLNYLNESLKNSNQSNYLFFLAHHPAAISLGPHISKKDNLLLKLANKYYVTAVVSGHNHNLQYFPSSNEQFFNQIIVGNAAKISHIPKKNTTFFNYDSSGGFATLLITKTSAVVKFFDDLGNNLETFKLNPR